MRAVIQQNGIKLVLFTLAVAWVLFGISSALVASSSERVSFPDKRQIIPTSVPFIPQAQIQMAASGLDEAVERAVAVLSDVEDKIEPATDADDNAQEQPEDPLNLQDYYIYAEPGIEANLFLQATGGTAPYHYTMTESPYYGEATIDDDGYIKYVAPEALDGIDYLEVAVWDADGNQSKSDVLISTHTILQTTAERVYTPQATRVLLPVSVSGGIAPYHFQVDGDVEGGVLIGTLPQAVFVPDADFAGQVIVDYTVTDAYGFSANGRIWVEVGGDLTGVQRTLSTAVDTPVNIVGYAGGGQPPFTVTVQGDLTGTIDVHAMSVRYIPADGFTGVENIVLNVTDATGTAVQSSVILQVVDAPKLRNNIPTHFNARIGMVDTPADTAVMLQLGAEPQDSSYTFRITAQSQHGTVLRINRSRVIYIPQSGFSGMDSFTYLVEAPNGASAEGTMTIMVAVPFTLSIPNELDVLSVESRIVALQWADQSTDETHYHIERADVDTIWTEIATVPAETTTYRDRTVNCGTTYRYRIRASRNGAAYTDYAMTDEITTSDCAELTADARYTSNGVVRLSWADGAGSAQNYHLSRRNAGETNWTQLATLDSPTRTFTDDSMTCGGAYVYSVQSVHNDEIIATVITPPLLIVCPSPQVTKPANQTHSEGDTVELAVNAVSQSNTPLSFTADGLPAGLSIDSASGVISGQMPVGTAQDTPYNVVINVTNGLGMQSRVAFTWTIEARSDPIPSNLRITGNVTTPPAQPVFIWEHQTDENQESVPGQQYRLLVYRGDEEVISQWYDAAEICQGVTCSVQPELFAGLLNGAYRWWVQAYISEDNLQWSNVEGQSFEINLPAPSGLTLHTPQGEIQGAFVEFAWSHDPNALWYRLIVGDVLDDWYEASQICVEGICRVERTMSSGMYTWQVVAWGPGGEWRSIDETNDVFIITEALPQPPQNITVLPNQGRPTVIWNVDPNALWYQLYIVREEGLSFVQWYEAAQVCTGQRCTVNPEIDWTSGVYQLWMQAWGPNGFSSPDGTDGVDSWGRGQDLVLPDVPATAPIGLSIDDPKNALVITWTSGVYSTWYELTFSQVRQAGSITRWYRADEVGCTQPGQLCTVNDPEIGTILASGEYTLDVRAWGPGGFSDPAQVTFTR